MKIIEQEEVRKLLQPKDCIRMDDEQITIFDALGLAIEDVASAKYVYERAIQ